MPQPDQTGQGAQESEATGRDENARPKRFTAALTQTFGFINRHVFSSLMRRIIVINMAGLVILVIGILYFNSWRDGLIEARVQSLRVQGEIIAAAVAASASVDSNVISVSPDRLLELQGNAAVSPLSFFDPTLEFPISPEQVAPLLNGLVTPTNTRARIYDKGGLLILDSESIYVSGEVIPLIGEEAAPLPWWQEAWNRLMVWVPGDQFAIYQEFADNEGKRYPEVASALQGAPADVVRVDGAGDLIVSVAVPVQRLRATVGALLLSTEPGEIDEIVAKERYGILRIALVAVGVTILLSIFLARTIAGPMQRLSAAAKSVQSSMRASNEIPDFTSRSDEIGDLSGALHEMTGALLKRINAIESFAADVAHELKNPLTSLRSAVETLGIVRNDADRDRLTQIITHDVQRLDRLISDISNASRLDAELSRDSLAPVDLVQLTEAMVSMQAEKAKERDVDVQLHVEGVGAPFLGVNLEHFQVLGHDSRIAQVLTNLLDNAISFSPTGGTAQIQLAREGKEISIHVRDEGRGIRGDASKIFDRFYTDRPDTESFGDHSGLGLSISRQIVEAHGGTIAAKNRGDRSGAVFTVTLPAQAPLKT